MFLHCQILSSSTVQAPLAVTVAEALLDMLRHLPQHWVSLRSGIFAAMLAQLVVPRVSTAVPLSMGVDTTSSPRRTTTDCRFSDLGTHSQNRIAPSDAPRLRPWEPP
jgi:hypothetical protein